MGLLTPKGKEFDVVSNLITEGLNLWGVDCKVYTPTHTEPDLDMDKYYYYDGFTVSTILFTDALTDVKLKGNKWSKEKNEYLEAYISIKDSINIFKGTVIDIAPAYHNDNAKFFVYETLGQLESVYLKVKLVPYRESLAVKLEAVKDTSTTEKVGNIIKPRPFLKR